MDKTLNNTVSISTAANHLKRRRLELGLSIENQKKIYLDTKYWILLRDAFMQRSTTEEAYILLEMLQAGVKEKRLVCPVYFPIFQEIKRQNDDVCLDASIKLIDELSTGICLLHESERLSLELLYYYRSLGIGASDCYPPHLLVWTKINHIIGAMLPFNKNLSNSLNQRMGSSFIDYTWEMTLASMKEIMGGENFRWQPPQENREAFVAKLNKGKFEHAHEVTSFKKVYLSEIAGFIDTIKPLAIEALIHVFYTTTGEHVSYEKAVHNEAARHIINSIYNIFSAAKMNTFLPTIDINATYHAAIRYDKKRKYKINDLEDCEHAVGALPYYDSFFTERSLCGMLNRVDINLAKKYSCKTVFEIKKAINIIQQEL